MKLKDLTQMASNLKKIFFIFIIIILTSIITFLGKTSETMRFGKEKRWAIRTQTSEIRKETTKIMKIFHLDLKGAPPKVSYLYKVLPLIKQAGANAVLIEYEDMFPFSGFLKNISAGNAYSKQELKNLIQFLKKLDLEVIPLVQTFGHLEYVLKLEEFQNLRELESFPQEICPSKKEAINLIKEMIIQVMALHPESRFIHIGCDEVRHLGACSRCSRTNSRKVFAWHVAKVGNFVRSKFPDVTPLIWDDMLRRWTFDDLNNSGLASVVQPVVWVYGNNINLLVPPFTWSIYSRIFPKIWVASAFKGAFGETEVLPDLNRHLENNLSWLDILFQNDREIFIEPEMLSGIFITGWSRYDHFAVLCELLPVGIPSLILNLIFLNSMQTHPEGMFKWLNMLGCPKILVHSDLLTLRKEELLKYKLGNCSFPGSDLYEGVVRFVEYKKRFEEIERKIRSSAWVSNYNTKNNFTSPWRVLEMFVEEGFGGEVLEKDIKEWKNIFIPALGKYFDKHTVLEWEEQNLKPLENRLKNIQKAFQELILRKTWPRRPLS